MAYVPVKLHIQKRMASRIWPLGHSLPPPGLAERGGKLTEYTIIHTSYHEALSATEKEKGKPSEGDESSE